MEILIISSEMKFKSGLDFVSYKWNSEHTFRTNWAVQIAALSKLLQSVNLEICGFLHGQVAKCFSSYHSVSAYIVRDTNVLTSPYSGRNKPSAWFYQKSWSSKISQNPQKPPTCTDHLLICRSSGILQRGEETRRLYFSSGRLKIIDVSSAVWWCWSDSGRLTILLSVVEKNVLSQTEICSNSAP